MVKNWSAEIVAIGSELLLGQIVDTNTAWLAARFQELGLGLRYSTQVGDEPRRMAEVLTRALRRSRVVITTGGIGPTEDDLTREVIARITGRRLVFRPKLFQTIQGFFDLAGFVMAPNNRKQAYIPQGATTIPNPIGTAPGFILETAKGHCIIAVPGVPREMKLLWAETVAPFLQEKMGQDRGLIEYKVLKVCGLGESRVDQQIGDLIRACSNPVIGLLASPGEIRIRLTATGKNREETGRSIQTAAEQIRGRLGHLIFGEDEDTLEGIVARRLAEEKITLGVAEGYTAGRVCQRLQSTGSPFFKGGWVIPDTEAPRDPATASGQALALAERIRKRLKSKAGLGLLVEATEAGQMLRLGFVLGKKTDSYDHQIGGPAATLPDRVTVMALDWLRKKLLSPL
ncbi:MAG: CinA family nicotinamide mononucleotide deamidase-related protein [Desulfobacterota bacterium]|jgi:nicotinamide-nucleotide amidase|nr:CinA family nicotinamide mononucleotide deamidase-related protein [Thermodesulfobacteriota bacterium]